MHFTVRLLSAMTTSSKTFLFWFSNEHSNFRIQELESLFRLFKLDQNILMRRRSHGPYILMDFPDENGPKKLMSRSVLAFSCYELWGEGKTKKELDANVKKNVDKMEQFTKSSFMFSVESYGKTIQHKEKIDIIDTFSYLPFKGKVDLKKPDLIVGVLIYYGLDPNDIPEVPYHWYLGRWIVDSQRKLAGQTRLKTRKFIGNTSMDPLLSLLMVNLAGVKPYDVVLDPFVGTGSILVAAGIMGGYVMGSDIDYLMLHGRTRSSRANQKKRTEGENIRANMIQYGMEAKYLDVVVGDASRPLWRNDVKFDAIITDPPYGIRESTERLGSSKIREPDFRIQEEHLPCHIPAKRVYELTDVFCDLMNFSVDKLVMGGRLVYWLPVSRTDYDEVKLPKNPCLNLIVNEAQVLTAFASRHLLVFEKVKEPSDSCITVMDGSALMYRFRVFENEDNRDHRTRKAGTYSKYGKATKRGQMMSAATVASNG